MAEIDSLSISIKSSAQEANKAIDSVIDRLGKLSGKVKSSLGNISNIGKNIDLSEATNGVEEVKKKMDLMAKSMDVPIRKVSKSLEQINEQYRDLGKGFELKGSISYIQKQVDSLTNKLENAKLKKDELEKSGKTSGKMYEYAVKDVIKYTNQIESLKKQLESLNRVEAVSKITINGRENAEKFLIEYKKELADFQNDIKNIGNVYGGLENIPKGLLNTPIENLSSSLESLRSTYPQATEVISAFEKELQRLQRISISLTRERIAPTIDTSALNQATQDITEKIESLQEKFKSEGLDFKFSGNIEQINEELDKVTAKLDGFLAKEKEMISSGKVDTSGFENLERNISRASNIQGVLEELRQRTENFNQSLQNLKVPQIREENLDKLNASLAKTEQRLEELKIKLQNGITMGKITENVDDSGFRNLKEQIVLAEKEAEALREKITEISPNGNLVNKFASALSKLGAVSKVVKSGLSGINSVLSRFSSAVKSALLKSNSFSKSLLGFKKSSKGFNNSLSSGIKTILKYGLGIRSLYTLINKIRSAFKDGIKNLVQYSDETNLSVSNLTSSLKALKNALAVAFAPIINVVAPYLTAFMDMLRNALNMVGQFFSALTGKGFAVQAKKNFEDYAEGISKAGKAAKKAGEDVMKGVRAFDELNLITLPDESDGGSGSGDSGGISVEDMFETVEVDNNISDFAQKIKDAWKKADFTEIGTIIGNKIKNALDGIDWDSIYGTGKKVGKSIATFLNGLISPELFGSIGTSIASGLNTAIYTALSFAENFDWKDFGLSIANGINNFFATFNFTELAHTLNVWVDGIKTSLITALSNIKWSDIKDGLEKFAAEIEFDTIEFIVGAIALKSAIKIFSDSIKIFLRNNPISLGKVALTIAGFVIVAEGATEISKLIYEKLTEWSEKKYDWNLPSLEDIGLEDASFFDIISSVFTEEAWLKDPLLGTKGLLTILFGPDYAEQIQNDLGGFVKENILPGFLSGFEGAKIIESIEETFSPIVDWFEQNIFTPISENWSKIQSVWKVASGWFNEHVISPIVNFFSGLYTRVSQIFEGLWIIAQAIWKVASGWFNTYVITPLSNFFSGLKEKVSIIFSSLWNSVKSIWQGVSSWFNNTVINPVKNAFQIATDKISGFFTKLWSGIKTGLASAMNVIIGKIESAINGIVKGINKIIGGFNTVASWAGKIIGQDWGGVDLIPEVHMPRIGAYAAGGFPEQYSLFMAGEAGRAEILGTVGGKTAVAGGTEITGIRDAIYVSHNEEMHLLREQNQLLRGILQKEFGITEQQIGKAARNYSRDYMRRTGNPAYAY